MGIMTTTYRGRITVGDGAKDPNAALTITSLIENVMPDNEASRLTGDLLRRSAWNGSDLTVHPSTDYASVAALRTDWYRRATGEDEHYKDGDTFRLIFPVTLSQKFGDGMHGGLAIEFRVVTGRHPEYVNLSVHT